jgi:hypothetical protein
MGSYIANDFRVPDRLVNKRLEREKKKQEEYHSGRAKAGRQGANVRWGREKGNPKYDSSAIAQPMASQCDRNATAMAKDSLSFSLEKEGDAPRETPKSSKAKKSTAKPKGTNKKRVSVPSDDATYKETCINWAKANHNGIDPIVEFENFIDYWLSEDGKKIDWMATWRNWYRRAPGFNPALRNASNNGKKEPGMWEALRQQNQEWEDSKNEPIDVD